MNFILPKSKENKQKYIDIAIGLSNKKIIDIILEGAIRSGKNTSTAFLVLDFWLRSKDKFHLVLSTTTRNAFLNLAEADNLGLYYQMLSRGIGLRTANLNGISAIIIQTPTSILENEELNKNGKVPTEKYVYFMGGAKADAYKRIKGNSYGSIVLDEGNELHNNSIIECYTRLAAAKEPKRIWLINPKNPNHFVYKKYLDPACKKPTSIYIHFKMKNNPFFERYPEKLKIFEEQWPDKNSTSYKLLCLGQRVNDGKIIYKEFSPKHSVKDWSWICKQEYIKLSIGVDVGYTDSTAYSLVGYTKGWKNKVLIHQWLHKNSIEEEMGTDELISNFVGWIEDIYYLGFTQINQYTRIKIDDAAKGFRIDFKKQLPLFTGGDVNFDNFKVYKADKKKINERIYFDKMLMSQRTKEGDSRYIVFAGCKQMIESISSAQWNIDAYEKGENVREDTSKFEIGVLDSSEYADDDVVMTNMKGIHSKL